MNADQVRALLRKRIAKSSQRGVARELGISDAYLCDTLAGRREPGDSIIAPLGIKRVVSYEWIDKPDAAR